MAVPGQQFAMTSLFDDAPPVQHHDLIRVLDGRQAVGDDQSSAMAHDLGQGGLDMAF